MNKVTKKIMALLLSLTMVFSVTVTGQAAENTTGTAKSYVTFSVEKFTIGQGYLVEPTKVEVKVGDTVESVFQEVMKLKGITHDGTTNEYGFFLNSINNADSGKIDIPAEISSMPSYSAWGSEYTAPNNEKNDGNSLPNKALGTYSYNSMAGWMFMVNNADTGESADKVKVKNGDVIRLQFSIYGWGADIGFDTESYTGIKCPKLANKDALSTEAAAVNETDMLKDSNVKVAYDNAITVLSTYNVSQAVVDSALKVLNQAEKTYAEAKKSDDVPTTPVILKKTKITGKTTKKLGAKNVKLTFNKVNNAKKYTIQFSTTRKFKKVLVKETVKKTSVTIKNNKLKNKKNLYVRVRAVGANKWSNIVKVTIKK